MRLHISLFSAIYSLFQTVLLVSAMNTDTFAEKNENETLTSFLPVLCYCFNGMQS